MRKLKILLLTLGCIISIHCSKGQTSVNSATNCLTDPEMDYFLQRDIACSALCIDTAQYCGKIRAKDRDIAMYQANEQDLKNDATNNKRIALELTTDNQNIRTKYNKQKLITNRLLGFSIGSFTLNVTFGVALTFSLRR